MSVHREESRRTGAVSFRVKWRAGGRAFSRSFPASAFGTGKAAEKKAASAAGKFDLEVGEQLVTTGVVVQKRGAMLLRDAWKPWYSQGCARWTESTQEVYASALDVHILPRLGGAQIAAIRPATVEEWIFAMQEAGVGPSAIQKATTVLSSLLSYLVRKDLIDTNPVHPAEKINAPRERAPLKVTPEQVERLRAWFIDQGHYGDATLISVLAYSGLRPESEGVVLDWLAVGPKLLFVAAGRKRGAKDRHITMLDPLQDDLRAWRRRSGRIGGLVLPFGGGGVSGFGDPWTRTDWNNWRNRRWAPAAAAVGLPADAIPRDLRGSFASLLIWEGRSVVDVAKQLGHKPSTCLDVYSGEFEAFDPVDRRPAVDVIREAREKVHGRVGRAAQG